MAGAVPGTASRDRSVSIEGLTRSLRRLRRISPLTVDAGLAAIYVLIVAVEATAEPMTGAQLGLFAALTLILAACIVLRRRTPLAAQVVAAAALTAQSFLHLATEFSPLATLVCSYSVGQYASPARARLGTVVVVAGVVGFFAGTPGLQDTDPANLFSVLLVWLVAWGVGYSAARRRDEQERARRALERQVIAEERVRVSRELHDALGHTVNLLVVHAGAARLALDRDPAMTRSLLQGMEDTGRATLADLDRVLAGLRAESIETARRQLLRLRDWPSCPSWSNGSRTRVSTSGSPWIRHCGCPAILTYPRTASSRRHSPTPSSMQPRVRRQWSSSGGTAA